MTVNEDGSYTYTPSSSYAGSDSFTYTVSSGARLGHGHRRSQRELRASSALPVPAQATVPGGSSNANVKGLAVRDPHAAATGGNVTVWLDAGQGGLHVNNVTGGASDISGNDTARSRSPAR